MNILGRAFMAHRHCSIYCCVRTLPQDPAATVLMRSSKTVLWPQLSHFGDKALVHCQDYSLQTAWKIRSYNWLTLRCMCRCRRDPLCNLVINPSSKNVFVLSFLNKEQFQSCVDSFCSTVTNRSIGWFSSFMANCCCLLWRLLDWVEWSQTH